jgi:hypothetical protein
MESNNSDNYFRREKAEEARIILTDLYDLLTERLKDLENVRGKVESKHAIAYYREELMCAMNRVVESINPIEL